MDINGISKQKSMVAEGERGTRIAKSVCWLVRPLRGWVGEQREERKHSSPPSPFPQPHPPSSPPQQWALTYEKSSASSGRVMGDQEKMKRRFTGFN